MKKIIVPALSVCLLSLAACHKDHVSGPGTISGTDTLFAIKLSLSVQSIYQSDTTINHQHELIVSETGGKVLLDTVVAPNSTITTTLTSHTSLVDLTSIVYDSLQTKYVIVTYKAVAPNSWTDVYPASLITLPYYPSSTGVNDTILYTNTPGGYNVSFTATGADNINISFPAASSVQTIFNGQPGRYTYLGYNSLGLYRLYAPKTTHDTVDCTRLDTAIMGNYNSSSYYTYNQSRMAGFVDSTNPLSYLPFYYNSYYSGNLSAQYFYPAKYFQKYACTSIFNGPNNDYINVYTYGNTVPATVSYPDPGALSINSKQNSNFSLSFTGIKPSYYYTIWQSPTIQWTLFASPDSTTLNPAALLSAQKSKLIQGKDLTQLTLSEFKYEVATGYNYASFLNLVCDSSQASKTNIASDVFYDKSF